MKILQKIIRPSRGCYIKKQIDNCLKKIQESKDNEKGKIIKLVIFLKIKTKNEFLEIKNYLDIKLLKIFSSNIPAITIVPIKPEKGYLSIEVTILLEDWKIEFKQYKEVKYSIIKSKKNKIIFTGEIKGIKEKNQKENINSAFRLIKELLNQEGFSFSDIVRQWNYVGNILKNTRLGQNYQIFNTIRSKYYKHSKFLNGYPAATGIGMDINGIIIDLIAIKKLDIENNKSEILPISNLNQTNPYQYEESYLNIKKEKITDLTDHTPKFERAKLVKLDINKLFISGTAAITGSKSCKRDIIKQTDITIKNILSLIDQSKNITDVSGNDILCYRTYIKNREDLAVVKKICSKEFKTKNANFLINDICREELLVEIEAIFNIS